MYLEYKIEVSADFALMDTDHNMMEPYGENKSPLLFLFFLAG